MTVTRQGVKFASQDKPDAVALVDAGRVIKIYDQGDSSILAALRLAQSKWGGVQVRGSEAYKRKCAELAARHGIRLANPEGRMKELVRAYEEAAKPEKSVTAHVSFEELKKRWIELKTQMNKATRLIAEPRIAEAARKQIEAEAKKVMAEKAAVYKEYLEASAELEAHVKKEPPEPLLLGYGKWRQEYEKWEKKDKAIRYRAAALWEKAGGDMSRKYTGYGQEEVERRLTSKYAREEAEKRYADSAEWKDIKANIKTEAQLEAEKNTPEMKAALDAVDREIRKRAPEEKRKQRIAELDRKFENGIYPPGTVGFSLQVDYSLEVLKLERERGTDERKALSLHPAAAAVLKKAEEYRRRDRGLGR